MGKGWRCKRVSQADSDSLAAIHAAVQIVAGALFLVGALLALFNLIRYIWLCTLVC